MMEYNGMAQQRPVWLATSFFCSRDKWNIILKKIRRLVEDLRYDILSYHIQTNNQYGENIRVSFLTVEEKIDGVGETIRLYFEPLMLSFPEKIFKVPISSTKLPFPTNTLEFGLYEIEFHEKLLPTYKIQEMLSKAMIDALEEEEITRDTFLTFALYLQVSLIKACSKLFIKTEEWLPLFVHDDLKSNVNNQPVKEANLSLTLEIINDIIENDKFEIGLEWLEVWCGSCHSLIEKKIIALEDKNAAVIEKAVKNFYLKVAYFICIQVGLSEIEIRYTNRLLDYSLKEFYKDRKD